MYRSNISLDVLTLFSDNLVYTRVPATITNRPATKARKTKAHLLDVSQIPGIANVALFVRYFLKQQTSESIFVHLALVENEYNSA